MVNNTNNEKGGFEMKSQQLTSTNSVGMKFRTYHLHKQTRYKFCFFSLLIFISFVLLSSGALANIQNRVGAIQSSYSQTVAQAPQPQGPPPQAPPPQNPAPQGPPPQVPSPPKS